MQFLSEKTHNPKQLLDEIEKLNQFEGISISGEDYSLIINLMESTYDIDIFQSIPEDRLTSKCMVHQAQGIERSVLKTLFEEPRLQDPVTIINHLNATLMSSTTEVIRSKELADAEDKDEEILMAAQEWAISAEAKQLEISSPEEYKRIQATYIDKMNQASDLVDELRAAQRAEGANKIAEIDKHLQQLKSPTPNLISNPTYEYISKLDGNGIVIDSKNRNIQLISRYSRIDIDYSQLVSCELCVDSETLIKTNRLGQVGGALLGGVLAGGVGALVGAGGAQKMEVGNIRSIEVKILTTNHDKPIHIICFFKRGNGWLSPSPSDAVIANAQKLHDLLAIAIHESNKNTLQTNPHASGTAPQHSLADELLKLADLKNQGLITEHEFTTAKLKLLS